jgi:hypothetical protein
MNYLGKILPEISWRPTGPLDRSEEVESCALEGLVAQHLRAIAAYRNDDSRTFTLVVDLRPRFLLLWIRRWFVSVIDQPYELLPAAA